MRFQYSLFQRFRKWQLIENILRNSTGLMRCARAPSGVWRATPCKSFNPYSAATRAFLCAPLLQYRTGREEGPCNGRGGFKGGARSGAPDSGGGTGTPGQARRIALDLEISRFLDQDLAHLGRASVCADFPMEVDEGLSGRKYDRN